MHDLVVLGRAFGQFVDWEPIDEDTMVFYNHSGMRFDWTIVPPGTLTLDYANGIVAVTQGEGEAEKMVYFQDMTFVLGGALRVKSVSEMRGEYEVTRMEKKDE